MAIEKEMSLFEHIKEMRQRIFRAVIAVIATTVVASFFVENYILDWLLKPLDNVENVKIIVLSPPESAIMYFKIALIVGFGAALPYVLYQICLLYTSPSPRDRTRSRMPSSA